MNDSEKGLRFSLLVAIAGTALVMWLYFGGEAIEAAISTKAGREAIVAAIWGHVGWSLVSAPLVLAYAFIRMQTARKNAALPGLAGRAGKIVLWMLCAVLVFLVITGPVVVWTHGSDLKVFNWFAVPTPTGKLPVIHDTLEVAHQWVAKTAPWLAGMDAAFIGASIFAKR